VDRALWLTAGFACVTRRHGSGIRMQWDGCNPESSLVVSGAVRRATPPPRRARWGVSVQSHRGPQGRRDLSDIEYVPPERAACGALRWGAVRLPWIPIMLNSSRSSAVGVLVAACALGACSDSPQQPDAASLAAAARRGTPTVVITASPSRDTLGFDNVMQLGAQALDAAGQTVQDQSVVWSSSDSTIATVSVGGIVIAGRREGTIAIRARVGAITGQRLLTVRARVLGNTISPGPGDDDGFGSFDAAASPETWTFCAGIGSNCEFTGLRDVRLVFATGTVETQTAFGRVDCSVDGFGDPNPEAGRALRCEYGPQRRRVLVNPMPQTFGMGSTTIVPAGATGSEQERMRPAAATGRTSDGSGTFRTRCDPSDYQFNDPLGNPERANISPLHLFFGNTAASTQTSLTGAVGTGRSTCLGGSLDRSVYYLPAVIDVRHGDVQIPADGVFYLRTGYNMEPVTIQTMPAGLVMVAGNRDARGVQPRVVEWLCRDRFVINTGMIPECGVGDQVQLWVHFPQCWDGRNLDSRDHRSHMAYAVVRHGVNRSSCPPTHPVALPQLSQMIQYNVRPGASLATWRLSTDVYGAGLRGGLSAHAHWVNGWNPLTMRTIVSECLNQGADCNTSSLGNGTGLH
jgi:hypothetical protein